MLEKWTNTSSPPSREMKPKPFSALKNFTVPVVKRLLFSSDATTDVAARRDNGTRPGHERRRLVREPRSDGWSRRRESNPRRLITSQLRYHYATPAAPPSCR